jgi:hypothetical protein
MKLLSSILIILAFATFIWSNTSNNVAIATNKSKHLDNQSKKINNFLPHFKDTIYVLGDSYIELPLNEQYAYVFRRNKPTLRLPVSSGNDKLHKGIKTRTGLFTVQSKLRKAISKQFNNAELINWVGFNYNIGFHGLSSSGYYSYLGKKPSSHGCVRISREDGDSLYVSVKVGTPVMVYEEEPARVFRFIDSVELSQRSYFTLGERGEMQKYILDSRLAALQSGITDYLEDLAIVMDGITQLRPGSYDIGIYSECSKPRLIIESDFALESKDNTNIPMSINNLNNPQTKTE